MLFYRMPSIYDVMPAEAGIQALNGIARVARDDINGTGFRLPPE
jgi:hypothetical protein